MQTYLPPTQYQGCESKSHDFNYFTVSHNWKFENLLFVLMPHTDSNAASAVQSYPYLSAYGGFPLLLQGILVMRFGRTWKHRSFLHPNKPYWIVLLFIIQKEKWSCCFCSPDWHWVLKRGQRGSLWAQVRTWAFCFLELRRSLGEHRLSPDVFHMQKLKLQAASTCPKCFCFPVSLTKPSTKCHPPRCKGIANWQFVTSTN